MSYIDYSAKQPHHELAERMRKRDAGKLFTVKQFVFFLKKKKI